MAKTFILHDESINTFGFWIRTAGIDLAQFKKNPVMYFMHIRPGDSHNDAKDMLLPIGTWDNIRVEGSQILADVAFDSDDEFAKRIQQKVEKGIIRMASAGIRPIEFSEDPQYLKQGQMRPTITKGELVEASIVDRGSNNNAFRLYDENMQEIVLSQDPKKCAIPLISQTNKIEMKTVLGLLKLADTANEAEAYQAIVKLNEKISSLEAEKKKAEDELILLKQGKEAENKAGIRKMIDAAVNDRKILEVQRDTYVKLAEKDFDSTRAALDAMPVMTRLSDGIGGNVIPDKYKGKSWDELDKITDALEEIKLKDPSRFKELYKEKFGKEPAL
jgi:hypothetical protein